MVSEVNHGVEVEKPNEEITPNKEKMGLGFRVIFSLFLPLRIYKEFFSPT